MGGNPFINVMIWEYIYGIPESQKKRPKHILMVTIKGVEFRQKRKLKITSWKRGFICFGGSDPSNITLQILKALDVYIENGATFRNSEILKTEGSQNFRFLVKRL